jgi:hypothetical protein
MAKYLPVKEEAIMLEPDVRSALQKTQLKYSLTSDWTSLPRSVVHL